MNARKHVTGGPLRPIGLLCLTMLTGMLAAPAAMAKSGVFSSPHNLSASGGTGKIGVRFTQENRVCIFCHTPHSATGVAPLWGRTLSPDASYTKPYDSTTLKASPKPDKPTGASRLCLSCHDGTIALNRFVGSVITGADTFMPTDAIPSRNPNLKTDLADDHPISFTYDDTLAAAQKELAYPSSQLPPQIRLAAGNVLQCTGCHDPHNNEFGNFLVMDNSAAGTPLCVACHKNTGWSDSSHNPARTASLTAGCQGCHAVHSAPGPVHLLQQKNQADNCYLNCHKSGGSGVDVRSLFSGGLSRHPVDQELFFPAQHDENETLPATGYHVECVDCHNPHRANGTGAPLSSPPAVNGRLAGVRKDAVGGIATREYEVCFRCHSGGAAADFRDATGLPNRVVSEPDQSKRFDSAAVSSYHPVTALRRGTGSSLLAAYQTGMQQVYCSDCHNNSDGKKAGGSGADGPHGSRYRHILIAKYEMLPAPASTHPAYSRNDYELCFRCHDADYIMSGTSTAFKTGAGVNQHIYHVRDQKIPCFACHDPHGVPGSPLVNTHLVNFSRDYTVSLAVPNPVYTTASSGSGSCTVSCHTNPGNNRSYP